MTFSLTTFDLLIAFAFTAIEIVTLTTWFYLVFSTTNALNLVSLAEASFHPLPLILLGVGLYAEHAVSRIQQTST